MNMIRYDERLVRIFPVHLQDFGCEHSVFEVPDKDYRFFKRLVD